MDNRGNEQAVRDAGTGRAFPQTSECDRGRADGQIDRNADTSGPGISPAGNDAPDLKPRPFCGCTTINKIAQGAETDWHMCDECLSTGPCENPDMDPPQGWNTRADLTQPQAVDEVRNAALEEAAQTMQPMLRSMLSRGEAATAIRALKSQPTPAPAQDEAKRVPQRLIDALRSQQQLDADGCMVGVSRQAVDEAADILAALAAMEGR